MFRHGSVDDSDWSGGFGSMAKGIGREKESLSKVEIGRRRRRTGSRKVRWAVSSTR